ncbi:MAG: type IIL restriction-modification enzyme MmeI [Burkholderiaceae bacterium]
MAHFLTQCLFLLLCRRRGPAARQAVRPPHQQPQPHRRAPGAEPRPPVWRQVKDGGLFGVDDVPWFNGGLFQTIAVPLLDILDVTELRNAADKDWSAIDVSIFGTLFERGLDPAKRSQTRRPLAPTPATIERLIDPVIRRPLLAEWAGGQGADRRQAAKEQEARRQGLARRTGPAGRPVPAAAGGLPRARNPACGSGNFLTSRSSASADRNTRQDTEAEALGLDRQVELATGPAKGRSASS